VIIPESGWAKPLPQVDPLTEHYFRAAANGTLLIERCPECKHAQHYPRGVCTECGAAPQWEAVSGTGTVYTFSIVWQSGAPGFKQEMPYVVALIDLDEGPRLMGNITGCPVEDVKIGARAEAYVVRADEEIGIVQWRLTRHRAAAGQEDAR
jgi:uncharacterized OB-fold protein